MDLEARVGFTESLRLALGADNVFDEYPDELPLALNTTGNVPYSNLGPFGRGGRFMYGRLTYSF